MSCFHSWHDWILHAQPTTNFQNNIIIRVKNTWFYTGVGSNCNDTPIWLVNGYELWADIQRTC